MPKTSTPDYYKILQVDPLAEAEVIEAAYRRLARKYHPDVYSGPDAAERMRELNLAYSVIGNPAKRRAYDLARQREMARQEAPAAQAATRTSGRQRAVTRDDLSKATSGTTTEKATTGRHRRIEQAATSRTLGKKPPSVRVSTGKWPAMTPTTGKIPVVSTYVYRPSFIRRAFEELLNLGQGILAVGLLYPIVVAICWFSLQGVWPRLGLTQHQAFLTTLALPVLPALVFSWWFGRRIRLNRL